MSPSTNHGAATWPWRNKLNGSLSSMDASRGLKGGKPSSKHDSRRADVGKCPAWGWGWGGEELGLSGALSRKSLLEVQGEGFQERLLGQEPSELGL